MRLLNITMGLHPERIGGAYRVAAELGVCLVANGHQVLTVTSQVKSQQRLEPSCGGHMIRRYPHAGQRGFRGMVMHWLACRRTVRQLLQAEPADILLVHFPLLASAVFSLPEVAGIPSVYFFHGPWGTEYRESHRRIATSQGLHFSLGARLVGELLERIERAVLRRASQVIVLSRFSAGQLMGVHGFGLERITVIPPGLDADRFDLEPAGLEGLRHALGLPRDGILLLTVRRLDARMGLDALLKALAQIVPRWPQLRCAIGGQGPRRLELERLARYLGLEGRVIFLGRIEEGTLPAYYQAADLFVLPTHALEGFGLVTLEALACGLPVLGTPVGATPEILEPLDPVLLLPSTEPDGIAAGIERFLLTPADRRPSRSRCREYVLENYSWKRTLERLEAEFAKLRG